MPDNKRIFTVLGDDTKVWTIEEWSKSGDAYMAANPKAAVFEEFAYSPEDVKEGDQWFQNGNEIDNPNHIVAKPSQVVPETEGLSEAKEKVNDLTQQAKQFRSDIRTKIDYALDPIGAALKAGQRITEQKPEAKAEQAESQFMQMNPEIQGSDPVMTVRSYDYWGNKRDADNARIKEIEEQLLSEPENAALSGELEALRASVDSNPRTVAEREWEAQNTAGGYEAALKAEKDAKAAYELKADAKHIELSRIPDWWSQEQKDAEIARIDAVYDPELETLKKAYSDARSAVDNSNFGKALRDYEENKFKYQREENARLRKEANIDESAAARGADAKNINMISDSGNASFYMQLYSMAKGGNPVEDKENLHVLEQFNAADNYVVKAERLLSEYSTAGEALKGLALDQVEEWGSQSDTETYLEIAGIFVRLENALKKKDATLNDITEEDIENNLTLSEQALIRSFFLYCEAAELAEKKQTSWYKGTRIAGEMVPFMLEFLVTGGVGTLAGKGATKGLTKAFASWIKKSAKRSAARAAKRYASRAIVGTTKFAVKGATMTALRPSAYEGVAEAMTRINDDGTLAGAEEFVDAVWDEGIETWSEMLGEKFVGFTKWGTKALGNAKWVQGLADTRWAKWGKAIGEKAVMQKIGRGISISHKFLKPFGVQNSAVELLEEFAGAGMREAIYDPKALDHMFEGNNFESMLLGFSVMPFIGGTVGVGAVGYHNYKAAQLAENIRLSMMPMQSEAQVNHLFNRINSASSAAEMREVIEPVIEQLRENKASIDEIAAVVEYAQEVATYKTLLFVNQAEENGLAEEKRKEAETDFGEFWIKGKEESAQEAEVNEGVPAKELSEEEAEKKRKALDAARKVRIAKLNNGHMVFILSEKPNEAGEYGVIDMSNKRRFYIKESDIATKEDAKGKVVPIDKTWTMDQFLTTQVLKDRQDAEKARMQSERKAQVDALKQEVQADNKLNLGTEESPVWVPVQSISDNGVSYVDANGETLSLTWEQVGNALHKPITVLTDKQIAEQERQRLIDMDQKRMAKHGSRQAVREDLNSKERWEAKKKTKNIPKNPDGTVDETSFWNNDPEGYAEWNDELNQDGGKDTREQIAISLKELKKRRGELEKEANTSDPVKRKAAKIKMAEVAKRYATVAALELKYRLQPRIDAWDNAIGKGRIMRLYTLEELAQYGGREAVEQMSNPFQRVRGFARGSMGFVYMPNIRSVEEYDEVMQHEVLAHLGLKELLGEEQFNALLDEVWKMMPEDAKKRFSIYANVGSTQNEQERQRIAADEYIAHLAEKMDASEFAPAEKTIWQKIVEFIKNIFRAKGVIVEGAEPAAVDAEGAETQEPAMLTDAQIEDYIRRSYKNLAENKGTPITAKVGFRKSAVEEASSAARQEYDALLSDLTPEEAKMVANNDLAAAQEAFNALAAKAPRVEPGESSKAFIERKRAYNEQLEAAKAEMDAKQALIDEIAAIEAENAPVLTEEEYLDENGFEVDEKNEDVRFSVRFIPTEEQRQSIINSIVKVTGRSEEEATRWLDSETSLAAMVNDDLQYLDYVADPKYKAIKDNSDYPQGTVDFNNICRKRVPFTRMFTRLQRRFPNRVFTADNLADIRTIMTKDGLTVACGLCYVEDRRQMVGEVAQSFIDNMQDGFKSYADNPTKARNAEKFRNAIGADTYVPQVYDLTTQEGLDKLYNEHRGVWEAFQAYNNARGQQSQNLLQGYAEYKREILGWSDKKVKSVNDNGGLRIFSYSDFEAHHLLDVVQIIIDCAAKGVKIQGYTKVPEFARAVANTGIKLNRSLIPLGDTGIVDGQLAFDPVEGIDVNDPNFLESNDNVGNILIGINDEQIRMAMKAPFVHYIIPYHARQKENIRQKLNVGAWTNYISTQNERNISDGKRVKDNINIYTDILNGEIANDRQFVEKYLELCAEKGRIPKFDQFLDKDAEGNYVYTPGYYKFLVDFKLFDENGNILPQQPVVAEFDDAFNMQILEDYAKGERESTGDQMNETYDKIVEAIGLDESTAEGEDVRFSARTDEQRQALFDSAKAEYGVTDNFNIAGYMLPDGSLLNFADKDGEPNVRGIDHRNIGSIINDREYGSRWGYVTDFVNEGAIRIMPESNAVHLGTAPSAEQREKLLDYFYKNNGYMILELTDENGNNVGYMEYDEGTSPYRIMRDIDGYFNEGVVPQQDVRFSVGPRESSMEEMDELFEKYNTNETAAAIYDKVSALAKTLDLKIRFEKAWSRAAGETFADKVKLNVDFMESPFNFDQQKAHAILHELIHSVTSYAMQTKKVGWLTPEMTEAITQIENIYEMVKADEDFKGMYAQRNASDMIAELHDAAFRNQLKEKNLFQKIVDAIKKLLGFEGSNALEDLDATFNYILDNFDYDAYSGFVRAAQKQDNYIRFSIANENQTIFVSNAAKAVEGIKQEKATPAQWLAMLEKNGGLKAAEDKWMGLGNWLKESDKKTLTKAEVLEFVNEHAIKIEETHYLENIDFDEEEQKQIDAMNEEFLALRLEAEAGGEWIHDAAEIAYQVMANKYGDDFTIGFGVDMGKLYVSNLEAASAITGIAPREERVINEIRLNYTTGGLTNRHEIALTVPTIESWNESDDTHFGDAGDGRAVAWIRFGDTQIVEEGSYMEYEPKNDVEREIKDYIEYAMRNGDDFNMSVGYAYNQITDAPSEAVGWTEEAVTAVANGMRGKEKARKILVIDEIQSKRHQEGREKGYRTSREDVAKATEAFQSFNRAMKEKYGENVFPSKWSEEDQAEFDRLRDEHARVSKSYDKGVPDAPFEKNWHELAMKRMLRYAAENGYDAVAWTKGEQQAERYNIGGVISEIKATKYPRGYEVVSFGNNGSVVHNEVFADESAMAEVYGKEMSQRIIESVDALAPSETATISGDNLRVGGEGMKGFYDKMLPAFMNKYGKKWGVKVEDIDLPNLEDGLTMHSVPVTEEMKASVMEGQVMFSIGNNAETQAMNAKQTKAVGGLLSDEQLGLDEVRFSISKNNRATIDKWLGMRSDLSEAEKNAFMLYIDNREPVQQLAMARWFSKGAIRLPEDLTAIDNAFKFARKMNVDPMKYDTPAAVNKDYVDRFGEEKKEDSNRELLSPDDARFEGVLTNKVDYGNGIVVYDVQNDIEHGQRAVRDLMNDHLGADFNCWCLLYADSKGNPNKGSREMWWHYNKTQKKVAFKDGKICAFCASTGRSSEWWDLHDQSHGKRIPVEAEVEGDKLGRRAFCEFDGKNISPVKKAPMYRGNKKNGLYEEWDNSDPNSITLRTTRKGGKDNSTKEMWDGKGNLTFVGRFKNGNAIGEHTGYASNGQVISKRTYDKDGALDGEVLKYAPNGTLLSTGRFVHGKPVGKHLSYHENGRLMSEKDFQDGHKVGYETEYNKKGKLVSRKYHDMSVGEDGSTAILTHDNNPSGPIEKYDKFDAEGNLLERITIEEVKSWFKTRRFITISKDGVIVEYDSKLGITHYSDKAENVVLSNEYKNPKKKVLYYKGESFLFNRGKLNEDLVDEDSVGLIDEAKAKYNEIIQKQEARYEEMYGSIVSAINEHDSGVRFSVSITPEVRAEMDVIKATAFVDGKLGLAPNGMKSKLDDDQWALVRTKNFKNWFGDWENDPENASKVVDENGEPMVVYHGSPYGSITRFDRKGRTQSGLREFGTYFSTNKELAQLYAYARQQAKGDVEKYELEKARLDAIIFNNDTPPRIALDAFDELDRLEESQKPRVYEVFLNIRQPKVFDAEGKDGWNGWHKLKQDVGYDVKYGTEAIEAISGHNEAARMDQSYDGIIAKNIADIHSDEVAGYLGDVFLVFDENPNQIKSATETTGEFSESEDIRFSAKRKSYGKELGYGQKERFTQEFLDDIYLRVLSKYYFAKPSSPYVYMDGYIMRLDVPETEMLKYYRNIDQTDGFGVRFGIFVGDMTGDEFNELIEDYEQGIPRTKEALSELFETYRKNRRSELSSDNVNLENSGSSASNGGLSGQTPKRTAERGAVVSGGNSYLRASEIDSEIAPISSVNLLPNTHIPTKLEADYLAAVERGDMVRAENLAEDAARHMGYTEVVYHGTPRFGFTEFESLRASGAIFTTTARNTAANYGGEGKYASVRRINKGLKDVETTQDVLDNAKSRFDQDWRLATSQEKDAVITRVENEAKKVLRKMGDLNADFSNLPFELQEAISWMENIVYDAAEGRENGNEGDALSNLLKDGYKRFRESREFARQKIQENYDELTPEQKSYWSYINGFEVGDLAIDAGYPMAQALSESDVATVDGKSFVSISDLNELTQSDKNVGTYKLFGNLGSNPLVIDAGKKVWFNLDYNGMKTTDSIAEWAKENGYTSVVFKNIYDYGDLSDVKVFFEPSQLKSADPVTYNEAGNVIPLSERFNPEKKDIRFSAVAEAEEVEPRFSMLPVEQEIKAVRGLSLLDDMGLSFIDEINMIRDAIKAETGLLKKLDKVANKTPLVQQQIENAKQRLEISHRQLEILQEVEDHLIDTTPIEPDLATALEDMEPHSIKEFLADFFTMRKTPVKVTKVKDKDGNEVTVKQGGKKNGVMLDPETLEKELGWSRSDWKGLSYIVSAKEGLSIDKIAEMIAEDENAKEFFSNMDTMQIKDEVIDFLQSIGSYADIRDYIKKERVRMAQEEADYANGRLEEMAEGFEQQNGMSVEEYNEMLIQEAKEAREKWLAEAENPEAFNNFVNESNADYGTETSGQEGSVEEGMENAEGEQYDSGSSSVLEDDEDLPEGDSRAVSRGDGSPEEGGDGRIDDSGTEAGDSEPAVVSEDVDTSRLTVEEVVNTGKQRALKENAEAANVFMKKLMLLNGAIGRVRSQLAAQREYDQETVKIITSLANNLLEDGRLSNMTRSEIKRLLSVIKDAVGKKDLSISVDRLMDIMISNQLRFGKSRFAEFMKIKGKKVDSRGVEVQGKLDLEGQRVMGAMKEGINLDAARLNDRIGEAEDKLFDESETVRRNAELDLAGYEMARQYLENIKESEAEEKDLRKELKNAKEAYDNGQMSAEQYREFAKSTYDAIRENRMQRVMAYENLLDGMAGVVAKSVTKAQQLREAEKQRIQQIQHFANSDMQGMPASAHKPKKGGFWNNPVVRFFLNPLTTFDQMLRQFGRKSPNGEGYLWNHFMRGWLTATENEYTGFTSAMKALDEKVSSVFGRKMRWSDLYSIDGKLPKGTVSMWDDGEMVDYEVTQGNLLYIYMVNKMTDGKMKLRKMGITEEDVDKIKDQMDPRFLQLADWLQGDFLPGLRDKYNAVHEEMFGAPMAAIDNYFPLKVLANARVREQDVNTPETDARPSTITGSIMKRTKNSLALDVLGSNAFDVVVEHLQQMEHWAAFAKYNRDLNTLLSYKKFRNRVQNMSGLYGTGTAVWDNFRKAAEIAVGAYKPATRGDMLDKAITNIAKGVTGAKISFRVYTAIKQLLSMPAFISDANVVELTKSLATPWVSWNWAMQNLPLFHKRWKSRMAGDSRLMETEADWKMWKSKIVELAGKYGMTPNAFIDALTVSIGAKAIYETRKKQYIGRGYSEEAADQRAKQDATILFNESQQSNEGAFLAPVQVDRTAAAVAFTIFRNSSMGYQRMFVDALRNLKHMLTDGHEQESVAFLAKQMIRDGVDNVDAIAAAQKMYNKALFKNAMRLATFGFVVQFAWNLGSYLPYLIVGDDDDEKDAMIKDAAVHGLLGGPIEGLAAGSIMSEMLNMLAKGETFEDYDPTLLPLMSDLKNLWKTLSKDKVAGATDMFNLIAQSVVGVNPQTITDVAVAIYDACHGDPETSKEVALLIMRILQCPQSQIEKVYLDEIDFTVDEALDLTIEQLAKRYAQYKVLRGAPLLGWTYGDDERNEKIGKLVDRFTQKAEELKRTRGNETAKAFYQYYDNEYEDVTKTLGEYAREIELASYRDQDEKKAALKDEFRLFRTTEDFYEYKQLKKYIDKYEDKRKQMKDAVDPEVRRKKEKEMYDARDAMVAMRKELKFLQPYIQKISMLESLIENAKDNPEAQQAYREEWERTVEEREKARQEYRARQESSEE